IGRFLSSITVFNDPDLRRLRINGSVAAEDQDLDWRGSNAFTILRKWNERLEDRNRLEFVRRTLRLAFPTLISDFDFETAAQTVTLRVHREGTNLPVPIAHESNGLLAMLVLLTEVAACPEQGVVAIDEPENGLHPDAVRVFWEQASAWCRARKISLIL